MYSHECASCGHVSSYFRPTVEAQRLRMVPKGEWIVTVRLGVEGDWAQDRELRFTESFAAGRPRETGNLIVGLMDSVATSSKFKTKKTPKNEGQSKEKTRA